MNRDLLLKALRNTTCAALYIFLVSQLMANGSALFGKEDNSLMPFVLLLLFSLSAAVVGGLIFGQSLILFFENKKKESVQAAVYSVSWLGIYTLLGIFILMMLK